MIRCTWSHHSRSTERAGEEITIDEKTDRQTVKARPGGGGRGTARTAGTSGDTHLNTHNSYSRAGERERERREPTHSQENDEREREASSRAETVPANSR